MRIDPNVVVSPATLEGGTKSQTPAKSPAAPEGSSVVELSAAASSVAPSENSPTMAARIERIRALLDRGEYPVDLEMLASRIVDDDILRTRRPA
jgi:flagellar biosynthesis anti-sigma factor FlgM